MFSVVYRWKIRSDRSLDFERAWNLGTRAITRDLGGLGSRLHKIAPGEYFAYAQWPDRESYEQNRQNRMPYDDPEARRLYTKALEDSEVEVLAIGEVIDDLLEKPNAS